MQYIRFLKAPRFSGNTISALITITSDLGESFMHRDSVVIGTVRYKDGGGAAIARKEFTWKAGMRSLKVEIPVRAGAARGEPVVLQVSTSDSATVDPLLGSGINIMSVWSSPFVLKAGEVGERELVERRLNIGRKMHLSVWEETKNSIALHIWYIHSEPICPIYLQPYYRRLVDGIPGTPAWLWLLTWPECCRVRASLTARSWVHSTRCFRAANASTCWS